MKFFQTSVLHIHNLQVFRLKQLHAIGTCPPQSKRGVHDKGCMNICYNPNTYSNLFFSPNGGRNKKKGYFGTGHFTLYTNLSAILLKRFQREPFYKIAVGPHTGEKLKCFSPDCILKMKLQEQAC